jgi:hypothetical protein
VTACALPPEILRQIADARQRAQAPYDAALRLLACIEDSPSLARRSAGTVTTAELREHWPADEAPSGH